MNDVDITGMTLEAMQTRAAALRSDIVQTPVVTLSSPMVDEVLGGARVAPVSYTHLTLPTNREV